MSETYSGTVTTLHFSDGKVHGCGNCDECCPCCDLEGPPLPAGTYVTLRLDGDPRLRFGRASVTYEAARADA